MMKSAVLFTGGKDSTYAMHRAMQEGYEIGCLLTLISDNPDSYMFHTHNIGLVKRQAEAMQLPLLTFETKGEKEEELDDLKEAIKFAIDKHGIESIVVGAIASRYQHDRVTAIADELKINVFSPLWQAGPEQYMKDLVSAGFEVIIASISAEGLTKDMLGKRIDSSMISTLSELNKKTGVHIAGEGGEYESFVIDGPVFKKKLSITDSEIVMEKENTGKLMIKKVELADK
ncbi:MAG: diphthine--ammonia ligase [Candidatus Woesearchaeota archaeon]